MLQKVCHLPILQRKTIHNGKRNVILQAVDHSIRYECFSKNKSSCKTYFLVMNMNYDKQLLTPNKRKYLYLLCLRKTIWFAILSYRHNIAGSCCPLFFFSKILKRNIIRLFLYTILMTNMVKIAFSRNFVHHLTDNFCIKCIFLFQFRQLYKYHSLCYAGIANPIFGTCCLTHRKVLDRQ